ncbi:MAG: tRNA (adenosine(37)-N6)-threonylcarbamoyltransferase complex dimerization subunit type 1 TsaB, partial [Kiloniellales bacterium]
MGEPRRILALDAAGTACSAAVWAEGRVVAQRLEVMQRGQSERLLPLVEAVMAEAGLAYAALDAVAVSRGPGGFTGVRIGLAAARGLALAWGLPLIGVTNFEALAAAVPAAELADRTLAVLLDSKRAEVYAQAFAPDRRPLGEPGLIVPALLDGRLPPGPLLLAGDGVAQARGALAAAGRALA